ncbi:unnamed protein product [Gordionus sp. m RMFG-2023]
MILQNDTETTHDISTNRPLYFSSASKRLNNKEAKMISNTVGRQLLLQNQNPTSYWTPINTKLLNKPNYIENLSYNENNIHQEFHIDDHKNIFPEVNTDNPLTTAVLIEYPMPSSNTEDIHVNRQYSSFQSRDYNSRNYQDIMLSNQLINQIPQAENSQIIRFGPKLDQKQSIGRINENGEGTDYIDLIVPNNDDENTLKILTDIEEVRPDAKIGYIILSEILPKANIERLNLFDNIEENLSDRRFSYKLQKKTDIRCRKELICTIYTICPDNYFCHNHKVISKTGECCSDGTINGNSGQIVRLATRKLSFAEEKDLNDFHIYFKGKIKCLQMACNSTKQCMIQDREYICDDRHKTHGICCHKNFPIFSIEEKKHQLNYISQVTENNLPKSETLFQIDPVQNSKDLSQSSFESIIVSVATPTSKDIETNKIYDSSYWDAPSVIKRIPKYTYKPKINHLVANEKILKNSKFLSRELKKNIIQFQYTTVNYRSSQILRKKIKKRNYYISSIRNIKKYTTEFKKSLSPPKLHITKKYRLNNTKKFDIIKVIKQGMYKTTIKPPTYTYIFNPSMLNYNWKKFKKSNANSNFKNKTSVEILTSTDNIQHNSISNNFYRHLDKYSIFKHIFGERMTIEHSKGNT